MDQWVTNSFYTSFPSFKKQDLNTNTLADDRREEYKKYLAEVSNKKFLDAVKGTRRSDEYTDSDKVFTKPQQKQEFSTRDKLLNDLRHSDFSYNFHHPDAIQDRNQKVANEKTRKKVELQQELLRQIEDKKLGIEKLRAKEREEDELLQRRLENQIRALHMSDELAKRNTEKVLISNPVHPTTRNREPIPRRDVENREPIPRRDLENGGPTPRLNLENREQIPRRDLENNIRTYNSEDGSPENRIKNDVNANDRQIYKFFSNSAPHDDSHISHSNHNPMRFNNMSIVEPQLHHISTAIHNPTQHCNNCRSLVPILCNSCCRNDLNPSYFCCYRCNLPQHMDVCNNCRRAWVQSWNHHGDVDRRDVNSFQRDYRPQILEITYQDHSSQTHRSTFRDDKIEPTRSESPDKNSNSLDHDSHSSSTHSDQIIGIETTLSDVPETVSLSKEDEIRELKRKNDILIAKYARNYGSLRKRKPVLKETNAQIVDDSFPLPLMREHYTTTSSRGANTSRAVSKLEYKWEIPVVQKQVIANKPMQVLTQVGAIAKQLQLEKLNFGND